MTNKVKNAFDSIYAEEKLKKDTALYIQRELQNRSKSHNRLLIKRLGSVAAACTLLIFTGVLSYNFYFTASAYVDFDVNPSLELTLNRFDRVIDVYAYNSGAQEVFPELSLKHKKYEIAISDLIIVSSENGLLEDNGLVSITVQTNDADKENELIDNIQSAAAAITERCAAAQIDIYSVNSEIRTHAHEQNISPAKYLAIKELMGVDSTTTFEHCKDHSISEIKRITEEYCSHHHGVGSIEYESDIDSGNIQLDESNCKSDKAENKYLQDNRGHHGVKSREGHHGGGH